VIQEEDGGSFVLIQQHPTRQYIIASNSFSQAQSTLLAVASLF
jgi:hypothetical protein